MKLHPDLTDKISFQSVFAGTPPELSDGRLNDAPKRVVLFFCDHAYSLLTLSIGIPSTDDLLTLLGDAQEVKTETVNVTPSTNGYHGGGESISISKPQRSGDVNNPLQNRRRNPHGFIFNAATQPPRLKFVTLSQSDELLNQETDVERKNVRPNRTQLIRIRQHQLKIQIEPTNFMQEWRTPPLWGVRDSSTLHARWASGHTAGSCKLARGRGRWNS